MKLFFWSQAVVMDGFPCINLHVLREHYELARRHARVGGAARQESDLVLQCLGDPNPDQVECAAIVIAESVQQARDLVEAHVRKDTRLSETGRMTRVRAPRFELDIDSVSAPGILYCEGALTWHRAGMVAG